MRWLLSLGFTIILHGLYIIGSLYLPVAFQVTPHTRLPILMQVMWVTSLETMPVTLRNKPDPLEQVQAITQDLLKVSVDSS
jgi:hypothetical protein